MTGSTDGKRFSQQTNLRKAHLNLVLIENFSPKFRAGMTGSQIVNNFKDSVDVHLQQFSAQKLSGVWRFFEKLDLTIFLQFLASLVYMSSVQKL